MRALLALSILLLAGCTTGDGHGEHDGPPEAIVGVRNVGTQPSAFVIEIQGPAGTGPMRHEVGVKVNETVERRFEVHEGGWLAVVEWPKGAANEAWFTDECRSFHVVFLVDPAKSGEERPDRTRECH